MEADKIDFKNIWQQQKVEQIDVVELHLKLKRYKDSTFRKLIYLNVAFALTIGFIIFIWYYYNPQFITTKVGISLIILSMLIFLGFNNKTFLKLNKLDYAANNTGYLQSLIALKNKQIFMQTRMMSLYFIMLSAGIALYMYEYASRMTALWAALTYLVTFGWIALNWFYIRPKTVKKQHQKIDEFIQKFKSMENQLKEI